MPRQAASRLDDDCFPAHRVRHHAQGAGLSDIGRELFVLLLFVVTFAGRALMRFRRTLD
jgi:hypothetical protein